jgi:hypothetical protein
MVLIMAQLVHTQHIDPVINHLLLLFTGAGVLFYLRWAVDPGYLGVRLERRLLLESEVHSLLRGLLLLRDLGVRVVALDGSAEHLVTDVVDLRQFGG